MADVRVGSIASFWSLAKHFRSSSGSGHRYCRPACLKSADTVAKVENRVTSKMSRRSIFSNLQRRKGPQDRYDGLWAFLHQTMWPLTSPRGECTSGPEKIRSSAEKDFCNNICKEKGTLMRPFCTIGAAHHFCALASASSFSSWLTRSCNANKRELNSPTLKNAALLAGASRVLP